MIEPAPIDLLLISRDPSGYWAGKLFSGGKEIGTIMDCNTPYEVEQALRDAGLYQSTSRRIRHREPPTTPASP
ncbi:hypothetical protein [Caballeronia grimmiae]|uniref:hypothetical protein n=1 Tax=Caballeronia grimmiae TaxID=1071679 RepID=UPI0038B749D5